MLLGGHVSITGGVFNAPERARAIGCDCMQIFSKNQMQWRAKPLSEDDASEFRRKVEQHNILETVIHDSYLINLASPDAELLAKSREAFRDELERADALGVRFVVFHPGAHMGSGEQAGLKRIAESVSWALKGAGGGAMAVLEITAGQGTVLGSSFEQLAKVIDMTEEPGRAGICFDTCHAYAAGYDLRTRAGFEHTMRSLEDSVGLDRLKVLHLNDSKGKQGSHLDRHESIGKGFIGREGFANVMNDPRLEGIPLLLETPGGEKAYPGDLEVLRSLVRS
jgi:deoxyribonuclease-4